jgi:hypothetical protein
MSTPLIERVDSKSNALLAGDFGNRTDEVPKRSEIQNGLRKMDRRCENSSGFELASDPVFFEGDFGNGFDSNTALLRVLKIGNRIVGDLHEKEAPASVRRSRIVGG